MTTKAAVNRMKGTKTLVGQIHVDVVRDTGLYLREHVGKGSFGDDTFQLSRSLAGTTIFIEQFRGHTYTVSVDVKKVLEFIVEKTTNMMPGSDDVET